MNLWRFQRLKKMKDWKQHIMKNEKWIIEQMEHWIIDNFLKNEKWKTDLKNEKMKNWKIPFRGKFKNE